MTTAEDVHDAVVMSGACVLGAWMADFIREAYSLSERVTEVVSGDGDDLPADIGRTQGPPRVILVGRPGRRIMDLLARRALPVVAALDEPVDSVRYLMALRSWGVLHALREQTGLAAANHLLLDNPAALVIERDAIKPARGMLATVMAHLGLRVRADAEAGLLDRYAGAEEQHLLLEEVLGRRVQHDGPLDPAKEVLAPEDAAVVRQVLSPLARGALSREIGPVTWVARTFRPGAGVVGPAGAARDIARGPRFHLPPGEWTIRMSLAFRPGVQTLPFRLTLLAGEAPIAKVMVTPEGGGAFEGTFTARHIHPEDALTMDVAADEGVLGDATALEQLTFIRTRWIPASPHSEV